MDLNAILAAGILAAAVFVFTVLPILRRMRLSSGNNFAEATVLEKKLRKQTIKSGDSSPAIQTQELMLKLEVRPPNGVSYTAHTTFLTNATNTLGLEPGAVVKVRVDRRDPKSVLILPETIVTPTKVP